MRSLLTNTQNTHPLNIAIVGAGRMGRIRAASIARDTDCRLVTVIDSAPESAKALATEFGCGFGTEWESLLSRPEIDTVVVSATHNLLSPISVASLAAGKHVFCEKPMARTVAEAAAVAEAARAAFRKDGIVFRLGCTLRHHQAVHRAHTLLRQGLIGQPLYIRALYGHGGRPLYDQEWRMVRELGGGGELLDQGIHLIDLSRWFLGDFPEVQGMIGTYYWTGTAHQDPPLKQHFPANCDGPVEDNAFLLLRTAIGQTATLHASWTQWKNDFRFEIFGHDGSLCIQGLGGSYGEEKLIHARRRPEGGVPEITELLSTPANGVWDAEWRAFSRAAKGYASDNSNSDTSAESATAEDGLEAIRIVSAVYDSAPSASKA